MANQAAVAPTRQRGFKSLRCGLVQRSVVWKTFLLFSTFLLLFGSSIQFIVVPKEGDFVFDILYTISLAVFVIDMILNVLLDPEYFACQFCVRREGEKCFSLSIGSFLFWCDVVSTLALLFNISYINRLEYEMMQIHIQLNEYGVPINFETVNSKIPVEYDTTLHLLVLVCKTARIARLIPSSTVVDISSRINFYWYVQRINPFWYLRRFLQRRRERSQNVEERMDLVAAARLKAVGVGMKTSRIKKSLHYFGFLPDPNLELKHHLAAMKIQHAWRWRTRQRRLSRPANSGKDVSSSSGDKNPASTDIQAETQVGRAMAQVTGKRLAITVLVSLLLTILFTYMEIDATRPSTMIVLHGQTAAANTNITMIEKAINAARRSSIPGLFQYNTSDGAMFDFPVYEEIQKLREREQVKIVVQDYNSGMTTEGLFIYRRERVHHAYLVLAATIITCLVWFLGVAAFAGPIMTLVITPIERMVRLLGMLTSDPLGYQSNYRFKKFLFEEDVVVNESQWTKEILKGMETAFLMSTILQIGNLMKVGFGSAGVEIIKNNLQQGQKTNMLILNEKGSTVSCIFLFCDIRQFTDATECLQEEVFVFTNRIAAVVHSICHSYGGSANKNVGDAFLVSWLLEDDNNSHVLSAKHQQADKALLSVVKICMALQYDNYYVETMSENAKMALLNKLKNRPGPIVQMGFGLHAGKAVQGAIGSQRKIDATYVSEAVEKAEFLESSTKQYGLKMLMSDNFHTLLDPKIQRRCRKIDQVYFPNDEDEAYELTIDEMMENRMELFTFDMDVGALWRNKRTANEAKPDRSEKMESKLESMKSMKSFKKMKSLRYFDQKDKHVSEEMRINVSAGRSSGSEVAGSSMFDTEKEEVGQVELVLPTGKQQYKDRVWLQEDIRLIRQQYTTAVIQDFNSGLQKYYGKDWANARKYFEMVLERFNDGPSNYFLEEMKRHNWKPPAKFSPIRRAD